ncbi:UNVERIFIED_CONTAM: PH, RCC1 and FYVE domains-containing protein 1 [Sesamum radiatum]|uniref:PH, RCC1 and FYVE domains-containing protein 1 n=1 Tax=Sesamum radiatum TaxID=300843 RepID=A0AAW2S107_SESRA
MSGADNSSCSGCHVPFNFIRKRHNCYNCGLVFCKACSSRKSLKASLAPSTNKPYRVCDDCFTKLQKAAIMQLFFVMLKLEVRRISPVNRLKRRLGFLVYQEMLPDSHLLSHSSRIEALQST